MFVLALVSTIRAGPIPAVFFFFNSLQEKFTNDIRSASLDVLSFLLADQLAQFLLGK